MSNYRFMYIRMNDKEVPCVRVESFTKDETEITIGNRHTIAIENTDTVYTYEFVAKDILEDGFNEKCFYRVYQLEYLNKLVEHSPKLMVQVEQNAANIDYLAMMTGIDIPIEEES